MTCFTPPMKRRVTFNGLQFAMMTNPVEFRVPLLVFASYCPLRFTLKNHDDQTCNMVLALVSLGASEGGFVPHFTLFCKYL